MLCCPHCSKLLTTLLHPIQARQYCSMLLTTMNKMWAAQHRSMLLYCRLIIFGRVSCNIINNIYNVSSSTTLINQRHDQSTELLPCIQQLYMYCSYTLNEISQSKRLRFGVSRTQQKMNNPFLLLTLFKVCNVVQHC